MESDLGSCLGDKIKINMILALHSSGPLKKTELYSKAGRSNINARKLDELEMSGIVSMTTDRFQNNITIVELTEVGRAIAAKLADIKHIMSGEVAASDDEMDYEPSAEQRDSVS